MTRKPRRCSRLTMASRAGSVITSSPPTTTAIVGMRGRAGSLTFGLLTRATLLESSARGIGTLPCASSEARAAGRFCKASTSACDARGSGPLPSVFAATDSVAAVDSAGVDVVPSPALTGVVAFAVVVPAWVVATAALLPAGVCAGGVCVVSTTLAPPSPGILSRNAQAPPIRPSTRIAAMASGSTELVRLPPASVGRSSTERRSNADWLAAVAGSAG